MSNHLLPPEGAVLVAEVRTGGTGAVARHALLSMVVTLDTSQLLMSPLKLFASKNTARDEGARAQHRVSNDLLPPKGTVFGGGAHGL